MSILVDMFRGLLLFFGIYLVSDAVATPGTQSLHMVIGGVCLGAFTTFRSWEPW